MTYNINILDENHQHVGDLMTASVSDITRLLDKGMIVVDKITGQEITREMLMDTIGVSDGMIEM
jgi:hypothetical protein